MRVAQSVVVVIGFVLVGCRETIAPSQQRISAPPSLAVGEALVEPPCRIFATAGVGQADVLFYFHPPLPGSDCGISWSMYTAPIQNLFNWGYGFHNFDFFGNPYPNRRQGSRFFIGVAGPGYQNGPNIITFSALIDVFSSRTFTSEINEFSVRVPGPPQQRIVALNDSGRVLIDTIGDAYTIIYRPRMKVVKTYPLHRSYSALPDTSVWDRSYEHAFRPDSSCPPSGDSILDSKQVRDGFDRAMASSNPNAAQGSGIKRERGGYIWRAPNGTFYTEQRDDPAATECTYLPPSLGPPPIPGSQPIGIFHTHPSAPMQNTYGCPGYSLFPGDGLVVPQADPDSPTAGGGSASDWAATADGFPRYVITTTGRVYRLDSSTVNQKATHKNRWERRTSPVGCPVRLP